MKSRLALISLGFLIIVLTYTYPNWNKLLPGQAGPFQFPGLSEAENEVFQLLTLEQREVYQDLLAEDPAMALSMVRAALQPNTFVPSQEQALPALLAPEVIAFGEFIGLDAVRWASGNFILYQEANDAKLLRLENFRSAPGPNLHVLLAVAPLADEEGMIQSEAWAEWQLDEPYLDLGPLKGTIGNQNFVMAPEVDPNRYSMIIIYSALHELLISAAPLRSNR